VTTPWLKTIACGLALVLTTAGCTSSPEAPATGGPAGQEQPAAASGASAPTSQGVAIDFRSEPDPPTSGDNTIEVTVRQPDGSAITDAMVIVVFSMPPMPSMNMPGMRSDVTLAHVEAGRYRGTGELEMGGTWNVAITATRGGETIGRRNLSIVAK